IVTQGASFPNDGTVWYPTLVYSHLGQPLYKFMLASWYSIYSQGAPYSPYVLSAVSSIYAPLAMGLAVFFAYLLFKEQYGARAGLLAGGLLAFMPIMLQKMHAGDSQVVPYGVFALFFFVAAFFLMVRRRSPVFIAMAVLASFALVLGSNLEILLVFCLSIFLFAAGFLHLLKPTPDSRELVRRLAWFMGGLVVIQVVQL
ncbi:MAG: hypothetical protein M1530_01015, partial [Candidatus Marsarchaeota archaeon]|nr:hypothetical protein [Candidatus Marsarchaeota archaeon]